MAAIMASSYDRYADKLIELVKKVNDMWPGDCLILDKQTTEALNDILPSAANGIIRLLIEKEIGIIKDEDERVVLVRSRDYPRYNLIGDDSIIAGQTYV